MTVNIHTSTGDIGNWRNNDRPAIGRADWLTDPLVKARILPHEFRSARIAPVVVGLARADIKSAKLNGIQEATLKTAVNPEYLQKMPHDVFSPHAALKSRVRDALTSRAGRNKPDVTLYPGYVFPDVNGGALYLDSVLEDSTCTPETIRPAAEILSEIYGIGSIAVGSEPIVDNGYGFVPSISLPSVVRETLVTPKGGKITATPQDFAAAASRVANFSR